MPTPKTPTGAESFLPESEVIQSVVPMPKDVLTQADIVQGFQSQAGIVEKTVASVPAEVLNVMKSGLVVTGLAMGYWWTIKSIVTGKNQFFKGI